MQIVSRADFVMFQNFKDQIAYITFTKHNNSVQSNLGRGPRRCESKSPLVTMARPKFAPKSTHSRGPIPKPHYLPRPWIRPTNDAKRHPDPIHRFPTMYWISNVLSIYVCPQIFAAQTVAVAGRPAAAWRIACGQTAGARNVFPSARCRCH